MIVHTVIFTWNEGVTDAQVSDLSAALERLRTDVGMIRSLQHGPDLRLREGAGDYVLVATFDDEAAWRDYQAHPSHKAFVADHVAPLQLRRTAAQIRI